MSAGAGPDLLIAGNLLIDDLVFADGRTLMGEPGGAALYTALGAALWGAGVAVLSVAGCDYPVAALETLEARGVELALRRTGAPSLRTWLLYEKTARRVVHQLGATTHESASPAPSELTERLAGARIVHLAPMPFLVQKQWVAGLSGRGVRVSLDPYEIVREENLEAWREVLRAVEVLFVSQDDLALEDAESDPRKALARIACGRMQWLAYKRGPHGGLVLEPGGDTFVEWAAAGGPAVDPTGAGDAFAGGFLAGIARGGGRDAALHQGVVSASFAIADWGARGLLKADPQQAEERRQSWFGARAES